VPARPRERLDQKVAQLDGELIELGIIEPAHIRGRIDTL
jgi:hypothetical protein